MENVKIEYEKSTGLELLKVWTEDESEYKELLKDTRLTKEQIQECLEAGDTLLIEDKIIEYAEKCGLKFCVQCGCYVDSYGYINLAQQCVDCAIGNGV